MSDTQLNTNRKLRLELDSLRQQLAEAHEREANARCTHCGGVFFETDLSKQLADHDALCIKRIAEVTRERNECQAMLDETRNRNVKLANENAEGQAREKVLRTAINGVTIVLYDRGGQVTGFDECRKALAMPFDSTALDEALKQAKLEGGREALLEQADYYDSLPGRESFSGTIADELRDKAEELK